MDLYFDFVWALQQSAVLSPFHCFKAIFSGSLYSFANNVQKALTATVLRTEGLEFLPP